MVNSLKVPCSALGAGVVGKELRHKCGNISLKFMCEDKWALRSWLLTGSCNIVTFIAEVGNIANCSWLILVVEEMEGSCFDMILNQLTFLKDKTRKSVEFNWAIIYCSWLRSVKQRIVIIQSRLPRR